MKTFFVISFGYYSFIRIFVYTCTADFALGGSKFGKKISPTDTGDVRFVYVMYKLVKLFSAYQTFNISVL